MKREDCPHLTPCGHCVKYDRMCIPMPLPAEKAHCNFYSAIEKRCYIYNSSGLTYETECASDPSKCIFINKVDTCSYWDKYDDSSRGRCLGMKGAPEVFCNGDKSKCEC